MMMTILEFLFQLLAIFVCLFVMGVLGGFFWMFIRDLVLGDW